MYFGHICIRHFEDSYMYSRNSLLYIARILLKGTLNLIITVWKLVAWYISVVYASYACWHVRTALDVRKTEPFKFFII